MFRSPLRPGSGQGWSLGAGTSDRLLVAGSGRKTAPRVLLALLAAPLLWGGLTGALADSKQGTLRLAVIGLGAVVGMFVPRYGILALVFGAPLLPLASRWGFHRPGLSFAEHWLAGVLLSVALRGLFSREVRPSTRVDRSLLALV